MAKYILFDTETTGAAEEDRIIQVGGMIISSKTDFKVYNEFCSTVLPIKIEAMEVHNITPDLLVGKGVFINTEFYKELQELNNKENYLIAHNINFDLLMLEKEGFINQYTLIDTLRCAKHLYPELPYHRLQYIRYALELYKTEEQEVKDLNVVIKAHDAIGDVLVMKLFLRKLVAKCAEVYPDYNAMEKLAELTQTPVFINNFKFGKYKGEEVMSVAKKDKGYLEWMRTNMSELDEDMKYTLDKAIKNF
jgi:DNA polymerase III alpha subunit (gram-positive type)